MALELNGSTGVSLVQDGVVTAADLASTLDLTGKTVTLPAGVGGKVLQVVQTVKTDTFSVGGTTTFTEVTGLTVSITPTSASSKILVLAQITAGTSSYAAFLRLRRDSTDILLADTAGSRASASAVLSPGDTDSTRRQESVPIMYLDSPNTASSVSYKIMLGARRTADTVYINRSHNDNNLYDFDPRTTSTITVMEIAA